MTRTRGPKQGVTLSKQQAEILLALSQGASHVSISQRMAVSTSTVGYHVGQVMAKLHVPSATAAVTLVIAAGVLTSNEFPAQLTGLLFVDSAYIPE